MWHLIDMSTSMTNTDSVSKKVLIVTREEVTLAPGEKIEFEGDIELV